MIFGEANTFVNRFVTWLAKVYENWDKLHKMSRILAGAE